MKSCRKIKQVLEYDFSKNSLLLGFLSLRKQELVTLAGHARELCVRALCPGLVLLLSFPYPPLVLLSNGRGLVLNPQRLRSKVVFN